MSISWKWKLIIITDDLESSSDDSDEKYIKTKYLDNVFFMWAILKIWFLKEAVLKMYFLRE